MPVTATTTVRSPSRESFLRSTEASAKASSRVLPPWGATRRRASPAACRSSVWSTTFVGRSPVVHTA